MHIHSSSPNSSFSIEDAATKIQAGFRGYRVRKQLKESHPIETGNQLTIKHTKNINNKIDDINLQPSVVSPSKPVDEEKSATKIQAGFRGFLVRKKQKLAADAATKIQASFRGFKARRDMDKAKKGKK